MYMVDRIYIKTTGKKLAFIDRTSLNIGFTLDNKLNIGLSIKL